MRLAIPDDWNNEDWSCFRVYWPNSIKWRSLLVGAIETYERGWTWDPNSGSILGAKAIGAAIWYRNIPLLTCEISGQPPEPEVVYIGGGLVVEENDMGQVVTDVTIEDGVLTVWFGPCCPKPLGTLLADGIAVPDLGDDPLVPPGQDIPAYIACGKATAAIEEIWKVADAAWETAFGEGPWEWPFALSQKCPELHGGLNNWLDAISLSILINATFVKEYVFQDQNKQQLTCELVNRLDNDDQGTTDDDFDWLKNKIHDQWGALEYLIDQFWMAVMDCIGSGDLRNISRLGATTDVECPCPEAALQFPTPPAGLIWYYEFDFRAATVHPSVDLIWDTTAYHAPGIGIWANCGPTNNDNHVYLTIEFDQINNGSTLTYVHVIFRVPNVSNNIFNTGNGNFVKIHNTSHLVLADLIAAMGDPALPGQYAFTRQVSDALSADDVRCEVDINGYHVTGGQLDDLVTNSYQIIGIAIGGTGPGPLSNPPA